MNESYNIHEGVTLTDKSDEKVRIAKEVYDELTGEGKDELLSKVKWSLTLQDKPGIPNSDDRILYQLEGNLRGYIAEEVSKVLEINQAENVFISGSFSLEGCSYISPEEFVGSPKETKASVISTALNKGLDKKPLEVSDVPLSLAEKIMWFKESRKGKPYLPKEDYNRELRAFIQNIDDNSEKMNPKMVNSLREDYESVRKGSPDGYTTLTSEMYDDTALPDGFIVKKGSSEKPKELIGIMEVKSYTPDELYSLMKKVEETGKLGIRFEGVASDFGKTYPGADKDKFTLGVDLNKEIEFADFVRGVFDGEPNRYERNVVVLRFPNDIPDNLLCQYGQMIVDYGYPNVLIQKLPLSNEEINTISKEIVNASYSDICFQLLKKSNFSNKEIAVLDQYRKS